MPHQLELQAVARRQFAREKRIRAISFVAVLVSGIGNAFADKLEGELCEK